MLFSDKTQNNIMVDLIESVDGDISTEEGTLIDHSFRGAAAEFERAYIGLGQIDKNGYAQTADREHLMMRAKERGIEPFQASNAVWKARFNVEIPLNSRFSSKELTYACIAKIGDKVYKLMCEQAGISGNTKKGELMPLGYIDGFEFGELMELLEPARDEEGTEAFRARYFSIVAAAQAFDGNRAQYKQAMYGMAGVGACKIYRVTQGERRIKIYFLDNGYQVPKAALVAEIQEKMDPVGKQGEGEGEAAFFHIVDICPCISEAVDIETEITIDTGYTWEGLLPSIQGKIDDYYLELSKGWENEDFITVRILKINAAIASVEGVIDVQNTSLNGKEENLFLPQNAIPVRGKVICRHH